MNENSRNDYIKLRMRDTDELVGKFQDLANRKGFLTELLNARDAEADVNGLLWDIYESGEDWTDGERRQLETSLKLARRELARMKKILQEKSG